MAKAKAQTDGGWESERIIALIAGGSGDGKSFWVANLKDALIYDTDIGGGLAYADARIKANNSERVEVGSYVEVIEDIKRRQREGSLARFKTVAIDHITVLQQEANLRYNPKLEPDYGRGNEAATREWRKVRELTRNMDFNLIATAHLKGKYANNEQVGMITDASKNVEADFGIVVYLQRMPKYPSKAQVTKWRRDPEDPRGGVPNVFDFTMANFEEIAGSAMGRARKEVKLSTAEQAEEIKRLLEAVNLPAGTVEKFYKKYAVDSFEEASFEACESFLKYIHGELAKVSKPVAV